MSARGSKFKQAIAVRYAVLDHLILVCGHYEGLDDRISNFVDEEISIGDYILTGGELPALVMLDAIARHIPGVLGNPDSLTEESPVQYTKPLDFEGHQVPEVLTSGNHAKIQAFRRSAMI